LGAAGVAEGGHGSNGRGSKVRLEQSPRRKHNRVVVARAVAGKDNGSVGCDSGGWTVTADGVRQQLEGVYEIVEGSTMKQRRQRQQGYGRLEAAATGEKGEEAKVVWLAVAGGIGGCCGKEEGAAEVAAVVGDGEKGDGRGIYQEGSSVGSDCD
ncbi:hypothetical protein GW17_00061486, partial [Ensete ventricosum]